jgi:hypothetical protein
MGTRKTLLLLIVIVFLFFIGCGKKDFAQNSSINETKDNENLFNIAKKKKKDVLVIVYAYGCGGCTNLFSHVLGDEQIASFIDENFVLNKAESNSPGGKRFIDEYNIWAFPTILCLHPDKTEIDRITGDLHKNIFLQKLRNMHNNLYTLEYFLKQLNANPGDGEILLNVFHKYALRGDLENVLKYEKRIKQIAPGLYELKMEKILSVVETVYFANRRYEEAIEIAYRIMQCVPDAHSESQYRFIARCLERLHRYEEAFYVYSTLVALDPEDISSYIDITAFSLIQSTGIETAIELGERGLGVTASDERKAELLFYLGGLYELEGLYGEAIRMVDSAISLHPSEKYTSYREDLLQELQGFSYADISVEEAKRMISETENMDLVLLDVRAPKEYRAAHLQNAINIPGDELYQKKDQLLGFKNSDIIAYCTSGLRSREASLFLARHGFERVFNLRGGIEAWEKNHYKTVNGGKDG